MQKNKLKELYVAFVIALLYVPIVVAVIFSFNDSRLYTVFEGFSFRWYETLFSDEDMIEALVNSLILATSSSLISAIIATLAALGFRSKLPLSNTTKAVSMIPIMIPEIIFGMVYLAFFNLLNIPFGMVTLIIAHVSFCTPYIFLQVAPRVASLDPYPTEAARMLGASKARAFWDITFKNLLPGILSGIFIAFAMSFDDVIISIFVTGPTVNTLPIKVYTQVKTGITPEINALCAMMLLVTIILFGVASLIRKRDRGQKEEGQL